MILPIALFIRAAQDCAPQVAWQTLRGIAAVESRLDPFALHDNTTGRAYLFADQPDAVRIASQLVAAGHNVDAGLLGINNKNWRWLGLNTETVFEACQNLRAAATVLTAFSGYNTGSLTRGFRNGYVKAVTARILAPEGVTSPPTRNSSAAVGPSHAPGDPKDQWLVFGPPEPRTGNEKIVFREK